jgi:hypothetical protein
VAVTKELRGVIASTAAGAPPEEESPLRNAEDEARISSGGSPAEEVRELSAPKKIYTEDEQLACSLEAIANGGTCEACQ